MGMDAVLMVCFWNTNFLSCFGHGCSGHCMPLDHKRYSAFGRDALITVCSWNTNVIMACAGCSGHRMLVEHERHNGLGMDALVIVCWWNKNVIMHWAWLLSSYAVGARTLLWFGHGCSGHRMFQEHKRYYVLGMDALVIVCSWSTNVIMVWAWMLWSWYVPGTQTLLCSGHGCSGHRMLVEQECYYALGMVALIVCSWNANVISHYGLGIITEHDGCNG